MLVDIESVECQIDDGSGTRCETFNSGSATGNKCKFDVKFLFKFKNVGLACLDITAVQVNLGPLDTEMIEVYKYIDKDLCPNESLLVPDKRSSVNLCNEGGGSSWLIRVRIDEYFGQSKKIAYRYKWEPPAPLPYKCEDCTLSGVISAGKLNVLHYNVFYKINMKI